MRRTFWMPTAAMGLALLMTVPSTAALIPIQGAGSPSMVSIDQLPSAVTYSTSAQTFDITAVPDSVRFSPTAVPEPIYNVGTAMLVPPAPKQIRVHVLVNSSGSLVSGQPGGNLIVMGE